MKYMLFREKQTSMDSETSGTLGLREIERAESGLNEEDFTHTIEKRTEKSI